jgi:peptide/nickel transport system ATP-binding protein
MTDIIASTEQARVDPHAPLLEIIDLDVSFRSDRGKDVPAVRKANLVVYPGQTVAIVGESGSGKSTTAHAIINLLPGTGRVTGGQILFGGRDLTKLKPGEFEGIRGDDIGMVPQDPMSNLNPVWKIGSQVSEALTANGRATSRAEAKRQSAQLLTEAGLGDAERRLKQYPHEFSGGMRQRTLIAIGLAARPKLLIADEPTSALDVTVRMQVLAILDDLVTKRGLGLVFVSHDLNLVATFCDRVLVMYAGRIVESCRASELANAQHPYTRGLLGSAPRLDTPSARLAVLDRDPAWLESPT